MYVRLILTSVLAIAAGPGSSVAAAAQAHPLRGFDRYIERALRAWEVPGLAIAVVKDDSVVYARGFGVTQIGGRDRVDHHTLFAVASTTKPMTATALGMLVDEGLLGWDDPVTRHISDFQLYDSQAGHELTVRDLLTHRSGLPRGDLLWWSSPYTREEVVRRVRYLRPLWPIRTQFAYQNIMFIAAGEVLESVSGMSWDDFVSERLFRPLAMHRSGTSLDAMLGTTNVATPHARIDGEVRAVSWKNVDNLGGAGAVNSSAWDMAQWMRLNLRRGAVDAVQLVSEAVLAETQLPQIPIRVDSVTEQLYPEVTSRAYGLGWILQEFRGHSMVYHDGALDGMRTQVAMIPEQGLGVVVIANLAPTNLHHALTYRVLDAYLGGSTRDWSRDLLIEARKRWSESDRSQQHRERARILGTTPTLPLDQFAGTYIDSLYGEMYVERVSDGPLVLRYGHLWQGELEHWHFNTFRVNWRDSSMGRTFVTFTLATDGEIRMMSLEEFGDFGRATGSDASTANQPAGPSPDAIADGDQTPRSSSDGECRPEDGAPDRGQTTHLLRSVVLP